MKKIFYFILFMLAVGQLIIAALLQIKPLLVLNLIVACLFLIYFCWKLAESISE